MKILQTFVLIFSLFAINTINAQDIAPFKKSIKFGGRIMYDLENYSQGDYSFRGSEFRRVRLFSAGKVAKNVSAKIQMDFAKSGVIFRDVYLKFGAIPKIGGHFYIGSFTEPSRLEQISSSKYITFIERASANNWVAKWNTGLMYDNSEMMDGRLGMQLSYMFGSSSHEGGNHILKNIENTKDLGNSITGRFTGLIVNDKENKRWVHLGASYSVRTPDLIDSVRIKTIKEKPPVHLGPSFVHYSFKGIDNYQILGLETFAILGPFSFQAEYAGTTVNPISGEAFSIPSYYAYVSYFLTGENRRYKNSYHAFSSVKPKSNFCVTDGGWGAWEIAARYAAFDMTNVAATPDLVASDITIGLNWYLNENTRIMYNFIYGDDGINPDKVNGHVMRFQINF